jgi:hypothetical protein
MGEETLSERQYNPRYECLGNLGRRSMRIKVRAQIPRLMYTGASGEAGGRLTRQDRMLFPFRLHKAQCYVVKKKVLRLVEIQLSTKDAPPKRRADGESRLETVEEEGKKREPNTLQVPTSRRCKRPSSHLGLSTRQKMLHWCSRSTISIGNCCQDSWVRMVLRKRRMWLADTRKLRQG